VAAAGPALGLTPQEVAFATALGASYAFMLPVGTPPNALVFGTGLVRYRDMVRVGFVLNLAVAALVTAALCVLC
jgi:sodium-dependent dicarboxylate transporter 2/3/5